MQLTKRLVWAMLLIVVSITADNSDSSVAFSVWNRYSEKIGRSDRYPAKIASSVNNDIEEFAQAVFGNVD
jgi:hypothetical protein